MKKEQQSPEKILPIGRAEILAAAETLRRYREGKRTLERRIIQNEEWYKLRHWEQIRSGRRGDDPEPASAWLFNSIANKHADAMDSYPEAAVLPREASDSETARQLSSILPVVLEQNGFEQTYSDVWWYKLKTGTGVYGVFWNPAKENGLGDIDIRQMDLLNLFWEPGIKDIQRSRNLFTVELVDNDLLQQRYPQLKGKLGGSTVEVSRYLYDDTVDTSGKSAVVDWYYKKSDGMRERLHYCKFVGNEVLYASENDPACAEVGWYAHGKYPVVFDKLFVEEGTPCGFGYIDIMKSAQLYIDKLNQAIVKNALMTSKRRFFIKANAAVNEEEFADWSKDFVHVQGSGLGEDSIREIKVQQLDGLVLNTLTAKIQELKETSGNRDFSQGGTTAGVTAASAIAALQESGSKLSRDMIQSSYRAFSQINYLVIELIRQFYDEPRCFRITSAAGGGFAGESAAFVTYDNRALKPQETDMGFGLGMSVRRPVFDIQVRTQRSSPFSKAAQNDLAKELYRLGFFDPQRADQAIAALQLMEFEGKEVVMSHILSNRSVNIVQ